MEPKSLTFCFISNTLTPVPSEEVTWVGRRIQVISHYGCCSSCLVLLTYEKREEREAKEAGGGGVEPFQAACKLLLFDHYIIASHAAPAVHSWSNSSPPPPPPPPPPPTPPPPPPPAGDVSPISMSPISQSQFIPLGEILCLAISAMNSAHKPVNQEALVEHLTASFPGTTLSPSSSHGTKHKHAENCWVLAASIKLKQAIVVYLNLVCSPAF